MKFYFFTEYGIMNALIRGAGQSSTPCAAMPDMSAVWSYGMQMPAV